MTKNERIEKRAVKLWAEFSRQKSNPELFLKLHDHHLSQFRLLARKLIRLEDKVKATQDRNRKLTELIEKLKL